jgi:hypothetical protein
MKFRLEERIGDYVIAVEVEKGLDEPVTQAQLEDIAARVFNMLRNGNNATVEASNA